MAMQVDRYERYWMWAATGMLLLFIGAIVATAVAGSAHPPSHTEMVDPATLTISSEFSAPGVTTAADGHVTVVIRAAMYTFHPAVIRVPAGVPVTFRITSADLLHGFQVVGTNVNLTVAPGYVSENTVTFKTPGEYLIVCNEYCGLAHHLMQGSVIVEARR
jgi:cytochrome c oxidase subunit 2